MYFPVQLIARKSGNCVDTETWKAVEQVRKYGMACVMSNGKREKVFYYGKVSQ